MRMRLLLAVAMLACAVGCEPGPPGPGAFPAVRGVFLQKVAARGTTSCAGGVEIRCEVDGDTPAGTMILQIAEEGTFVEAGDLLVQLDSSALRDKRLAEQIVLNRLQAELAEAESQVDKAAFAIEEYSEGVFPEQKQAIENEIFAAQGRLRTAERQWASAKEDPKRSEGGEDLDALQFHVDMARRELDRIKQRLAVLETYTKPRQLRQLEGEHQSAEAKLRAKRQEVEIFAGMLKKIDDQITACEIRAPSPGVVFYVNVFGPSEETTVLIAEGARVRRHQAILRLARLDELVVRIEVAEVEMPLLWKDMPAEIFFGAASTEPLLGKIAAIHPYPTPGTRGGDGRKKYEVLVAVDGPPGSLRPGLAADVVVPIVRLDDVVQVPASAVFVENSMEHCLVSRRGAWQPRPVVTGPADGKMVVIQEGLESGEVVAIHPRQHHPER